MRQSLDIWNNLPDTVRQNFEKQSLVFEKKRGEMFYRQGDDPKGIYFVRKGLIGLTIIGSESGKEHLVRFFKCGQFFGHRSLFTQEAYHGTATALEQTEVVLVPKKIIFEAIETTPQILKNIVHVLSLELKRAEVQHVQIIENQILSRVAFAVVYLKDIYPEHNWTRQEIANFCASTVSTVIKTLAELENKGFIRQIGRRIDILNRDALVGLDDELTASI